jgi:hypothetical protein
VRRARRQRTRGQSLAEYIILAGLLLIALVAIFNFFPNAIRDFCGHVLTVFGLPIL